MAPINPFLWYRDKHVLQIGGVTRYVIEYTRADADKTHIYCRLKNIEKSSLRAIHLLNGPFILYCHVVPHNYHHNQKFVPDNKDENKEVVFHNHVKPGQTFNVRLNLNDNSFVRENDEKLPVYSWSVDIVSQIVISRNTSILYDFMIGDDLEKMRKLNTGSLQSTLTSINPSHLIARSLDDNGTLNKSNNPHLKVIRQTVDDLWATRPKHPDKPIHLVIVTHGIFSNLTADMLYLKDSIENNVAENVVVKGFKNNAGRTEKGVKKLGIGLANYLVDLINHMTEHGYKIDKISFIGHSLGGLVQLYGIKHVLLKHGSDFFSRRGIQPTNLTFMASPLLGVLSEMSFLISWFLDLGTLGKTGRDLTLLKRIPNIKQVRSSDTYTRDHLKPLLETLPDEPLKSFMGEFKHLTVYANAINDGIVPLRTSALLYLDYEALGDINELKRKKSIDKFLPHHDDHLLSVNESSDTVGVIPDDNPKEDYVDDDKDNREKQTTGTVGNYWDLFWLNFTSPFEKTDKTEEEERTKRKLTRREKKFLRITAKGSDKYNTLQSTKPEECDSASSGSDGKAEVEDNGSLPTLNIPPKASAVESAISTVLCPTPSSKYIMNPELRNSVIFHDKFYHFQNLPVSDMEKEQGEHGHKHMFRMKKSIFNYNDWKLEKQVRIAKKYHQPNMNWRKVLVCLPPDAHNNIVVRRRFANGFGWGVVDHLCTELFDVEEDVPGQIRANL